MTPRAPAAFLSLALLVAGCASTPEPAAPDRVVHYRCSDGPGIEVRYFNTRDHTGDRVQVHLERREYALPRAISASGARYSDGTHTWWNKGNGGFFQINEETVLGGCEGG